MNGLEDLKRLAYENACCRCQYYENGKCENKGECVWSNIEKELKDYHEIKEIAKRYHFDDLARDTHMTTTDEKYLRLFNGAIPDIQANYRKARAFEIIKRGLVVTTDKTELAERCLKYGNDIRVFHIPHNIEDYDLLEKELLG